MLETAKAKIFDLFTRLKNAENTAKFSYIILHAQTYERFLSVWIHVQGSLIIITIIIAHKLKNDYTRL